MPSIFSGIPKTLLRKTFLCLGFSYTCLAEFFFTVALEMMDTPQMGCFWKLCFPGTELLFFPSVMKPFAAVNPLQLLTQVYANTLNVSKFFLWCSIVGTRKTGFWPYLFVLRNNCLYTTSVTEQLFHTSACVHRDMKHAESLEDTKDALRIARGVGGVNSDGMTQTLWARKFYEIATHYVCAKNPQAAYLHEARLLSRLCVERYTTRSSTGSISCFERAWTSYTCFRDRGTSPADFAPVGPPVILDTTLKACDGGFSFSGSLIACKVLFAVG